MPSRITLAAAEFHILAVDRKILSTWMIRSVSASRTRSPVVGPNMSA